MQRIFSIVLAILTILSQIPTGTVRAENSASAAAKIFADVKAGEAYSDSIQYLRDLGIVSGYQSEAKGATAEETPFRPDYSLNRAELVKMMVKSSVDEKTIENCQSADFPDVAKADWFSPFVCVAKQKGIVKGYPDGSFKPAQAVNFAEASKIIAGTLNLSKPGIRKTEPWFTPFVKSLGVRHAIPPSIRSFGKRVTRGELARMIHAARETVDEESLNYDKLADLNEKQEELPQVDSCDALIEKLKLNEEPPIYRVMGPRALMMEREGAAADMAGEAPAKAEKTSEATGIGGGGSEDFSQTNVQVEGVDEADIIKNDGKYIYLIKGQTVRIIEAYPGENLKELSTITLDDSYFMPQEMYTDADQMVIIGNTHEKQSFERPTPGPMVKDFFIPEPIFGSNRTKIVVVNISNRESPVIQRTLEIEGNYTSSRKIGKNVYFVLNQFIPYYRILEKQTADVIIPKYKDSREGDEKPIARCMDILTFPDSEERSYLIVAGLNIADPNAKLNRKVLIGASQNVYASPENLYVAAVNFSRARSPIIEEPGIGAPQVFRAPFPIGETGTTVYRFKLSNDEIEYQNQGRVPGTILNQFSMDESGGNFRIATERQLQTAPYTSDNNLFILNRDSMEISGKVTGIAPGEHIKSVRFMGKRAYMVTFKNVDPLFVIDVEDPTNPKILGKLKIPGYSEYLHPYDDTHLIGFGREVDESIDADKVHSDNAVYYTALLGMKLSLFDVSDVENPKEMFKEVIGYRGTTSELLTNHKALLFNRSKNLLAFPVTITQMVNEDPVTEFIDQASTPIETTFQGGIVYTVDLEKGFQLRGKVTHYEDDTAFKAAGEYFYGNPGLNVQRLLYIGENLYAVSPDVVSAYTLSTVTPIKKIDILPKTDYDNGVEPDPGFIE